LKKKKQLIAAALIMLTLFSCHPDKQMQQTEANPKADIDSVFFYKQHDVESPLIDAVLDTTDYEPLVLKKQLVPKVKPAVDYKLISGYRVQIFAGFDSINALITRDKALQQTNEPFYIVRSGEMVKVQVGDFPYQAQAYKLRDDMVKNGFKGAWVVQCEIRIPLTSDISKKTAAVPEVESVASSPKSAINVPSSTVNSSGKYTIQVAAVSDESRAQQLVYELKNKFQMEARYKLVGTVYKIYLGNFVDRASSDSTLQSVRAQGYPDAWLVY
jgi:cell division septation protein DedD